MSELRDRALIERDLTIRPADGHNALLRYDEARERLAADVGPLLERLDHRKAELEKFKPQPMSQQCRDGLHGGEGEWKCHNCRCLCHTHEERLDQAERENKRLRGEVEGYKRYEAEAERQFVEYVDEAAESSAALAAAQARAEAAEAKIARVEVACADVESKFENEHLLSFTHSGYPGVEVWKIRAALALAGDAARPRPAEPEKNAAGDVRCRNCGQYVNVKCWNCGTLRADDPYAPARPLPEPEQPPSGEEICHCGQPVDTSEYRNRGMCTRCDDVRCDAYPGECKPKPLRHQPASSFGYAYCAVCHADWPCHAARAQADSGRCTTCGEDWITAPGCIKSADGKRSGHTVGGGVEAGRDA